MHAAAAEIIARLELQPHPEGGWYRQTWRADAVGGERPGATAIHFLLEAGQVSHWHRVDAAEIWLWHAGAPITLSLAPEDAGPVDVKTLGPDVLSGQSPQLVVPIGWWQSAVSQGDWTLVSCVVAPGFRFEGFELALPGWMPGAALDNTGTDGQAH